MIAQTFFRQTENFFPVAFHNNDYSSILVNGIQLCHNYSFQIICLAKINQKIIQKVQLE